jgi:hypothetical protein
MRNHTEFRGKLMAQGKLGEAFEVLTVVTVETVVFCNVTLLSGRPHSSTLKMEAAGSSETLVNFYQTI